MIERVCETCDNHFFVSPYRVREGTGRFCSLKCYGASPGHISHSPLWGKYERSDKVRKTLVQRCHERFAGVQKLEEHKRKIGEANRGKKRPDLVAFRGPGNHQLGHSVLPETKEKIRQKHLAYIARTPIEQRRLSPETKAKLSAVRKQQWQDPEYVAKLIKAMALSPNKLEQRIIKILEPTYPEYKYNGDFGQGICLGGLTPDFVNINGRKEVIEILGDYWHSPEIIGNDWRRSAEGKVEIYKSVGHKCLILWESEINQSSDVQILDKVRQFHEGGKICLV